MKAQTIAVVGLGRTGASIGLALRAAGKELHIVGHDRNEDAMKQAKKLGAMDAVQRNLPELARTADILALVVPAGELQETLRVIGPDVQPHALVLDMSSLKVKGQQWAAQYLQHGHYVGARPIWSTTTLLDRRTGIEAARADLFQNSIYCLMPVATAEPKAVETAVNLGILLGAKPFFIDAAEYDSLEQAVHTLPGFMASALFRAIAGSQGWRDMARLAQEPFALATSPLQQSSDLPFVALNEPESMLFWLDAIAAEIQQLRDWVAAGETDLLTALFSQLDAERSDWLDSRRENEWQGSVSELEQPPGFLQMLLGRRPKKEK